MFLKLLLSVIISFLLNLSASAQVGKNDLINLLSGSDKKNIQKIETVSQKGNDVENEAKKIKESKTQKDESKTDKKYFLKRLEASQYYQKANSDFIFLLKDNISNFWKKNKNLQISSVKNYEDKAAELTRKAKSLRYVAEDLIYPDEKLPKILEAEEIEKEAIEIFIKVLYAYLNQPIDYDVIKLSDNNIDTLNIKSGSTKSSKSKSITEINYIPLENTKSQDSIIKKEPELALSSHLNTKNSDSQSSNADKDTLTTKANQKIADNADIYEKIEVTEDQVDKFNKFLSDSFPDNYENYIINFRSLNYSNIDSLKNAWRRYLYASSFSDESEISKSTTFKDSSHQVVSDNPIEIQSTSINSKNQTISGKKALGNSKNKLKNPTAVNDITELNSKKETIASLKKNSEKIPDKRDAEKKNIIVNATESNNQVIAEGFIYRVQIAACRIQVDSISLRTIYNGEYNTLELKEEEWFKYAIGELKTYSEAKELNEKIKIPGAFVIAYLHGKRIQILNSLISEVQYNSYDSTLVFKVQIAASKVKLNQKYVDHIYKGSKKVEEIFEDGWYKYGVIMGPSLNTATKFINEENIPGAFITSYLGNRKIELKEAIRLKNKNRNK